MRAEKSRAKTETPVVSLSAEIFSFDLTNYFNNHKNVASDDLSDMIAQLLMPENILQFSSC